MARSAPPSPGTAASGATVEAFYGQGQVLMSCPHSGVAWLDPCAHLDEDGLECGLDDPLAIGWATVGTARSVH